MKYEQSTISIKLGGSKMWNYCYEVMNQIVKFHRGPYANQLYRPTCTAVILTSELFCQKKQLLNLCIFTFCHKLRFNSVSNSNSQSSQRVNCKLFTLLTLTLTEKARL